MKKNIELLEAILEPTQPYHTPENKGYSFILRFRIGFRTLEDAAKCLRQLGFRR
jgi:hypothetical protein